MFDITPDDIARLNDKDLRELVGRLCEAELTARGLSTAPVTWGGNQTAPDGGLDVRVSLPTGATIDGYIPRHATGFQVKTPDMPRKAILSEMCPTGVIRPVIQTLADDAGAYIIVSSQGSTADGPLRARQAALREALHGVPNAEQLHTDFYDRTRLASWVRRFPGLITWVKARIGRALSGWHPYGPWAGADADTEYLADDKLRLHLGNRFEDPALPIAAAIDSVRDELARTGSLVRLVGLSGVGKTRLAQALFDTRIGERALPASLAVYANLSDNLDPQPVGLASDLLASGIRAILIVDNCPPDLHGRLADVCGRAGSTVSVLTIEYDVRDDQPERTRVVTLDTSSPSLIAKLVGMRYPHLSVVDRQTIADASGGNARIAIALAETVERSDSIAGLSNEELFQRLFRQRHDPDGALLMAAEACSLVYSFEGETLRGEEAELPALAALIDQTPSALYRYVRELVSRNLAQQRGVWRAVLPHAIANRLATRALQNIPYDLIEHHLLDNGNERLAKSFSRRLSFLHDHPVAVKIVECWLAPDGRLGNVAVFDDVKSKMFVNVASVSPKAALSALERLAKTNPETSASTWHGYLLLLRSIAYEPALFERSADLLARAAIANQTGFVRSNAADTFASLFTLYLSGTHATIAQRLCVIERLLRSLDDRQRKIGLLALGKALRVTHFSASHEFGFGARSRDFGYQPGTKAETRQWYGAILSTMARLALTEGHLTREILQLLGQRFRPLWAWAGMHDELEPLALTIADKGFWLEGWLGCRQLIKYDGSNLPPALHIRLIALEVALRPKGQVDQARAIVHGDYASWTGLDDDIDPDTTSGFERSEVLAREFGMAIADDEAALASILPDILSGGTRAWAFGAGLGCACQNIRATWDKLKRSGRPQSTWTSA